MILPLLSLLTGGGAALAAPTFVGAASNSGVSSASVTPHASTIAGDLLVGVIHFKDSDNTYSLTWPSGFTEIFNKIVTSGAGRSIIAVATKISSGSDGSQSFSWTGYSNAGVAILTARGQLGSNPITAYGSSITTASSTSIAIGSISPGKAALLLAIANGFDASSTWTPPGSMSEDYDFSAGSTGGLRCTLAHETVVAGATGTRTFTFSSSDDLSGILVAVE